MTSNRSELEAQLLAHLDQVQLQPAARLDSALLGAALLAPQFGEDTSRLVAGKLVRLLPMLQQDPSLVTRLLLRLLEQSSFSEIQAIDPDLDFAAGLDPSYPPFNAPTVTLLSKAADSKSDAELLARMPKVLHALVKLWLYTQESRTATNIHFLLLKLLRVDGGYPQGFEDDPRIRSLYPGGVWRRLFGDKDIYELFYDVCDLTCSQPELSHADKTQAQGRLLELLPKMAALNWDIVLRSHNVEIESRHGLRRGEGLLHFAAFRMVDVKSDIMMDIMLTSFYADLLKCVDVPSPKG